MSEDIYKIPCGELPERYPRTNLKKYQQASIWEKMGPQAKKDDKNSTFGESVGESNAKKEEQA